MKRSILLACALVVSCRAEGGNPPVPAVKPSAPPARVVQTDVTAEDYAMPPLPKGRVTLTDAYGGKHVVNVEIAATHDARTRGLMWRTALAEGDGMLFLFHEQSNLSFWMRNTLIPLDMVFIGKDLKIVGIVERAEPKTLSSRSPGKDSMYVLEVPSGYAEKMGLKAGLSVKFEGTDGLAVEE